MPAPTKPAKRRKKLKSAIRWPACSSKYLHAWSSSLVSRSGSVTSNNTSPVPWQDDTFAESTPFPPFRQSPDSSLPAKAFAHRASEGRALCNQNSGEEADAGVRVRLHPAGGVYRRAQDGARNERGCGTCEHGRHGVLIERSAGSVSIPQDAFIAALRMGRGMTVIETSRLTGTLLLRPIALWKSPLIPMTFARSVARKREPKICFPVVRQSVFVRSSQTCERPQRRAS